MEALEWGGLLHDIGKIGVPDAVLLKQERLTREERTTMNRTRSWARRSSPRSRSLAPELPIIRHHHEWFNGSGYPDRLVGDEIPKLARILHVADAFEAMTAARPYRMTPLTPEQALAELRKFGGIQFDPDVVDAFVRTKWARGLADPGSDEVRDVPLIGQTRPARSPSLAAGAGPLPARQLPDRCPPSAIFLGLRPGSGRRRAAGQPRSTSGCAGCRSAHAAAARALGWTGPGRRRRPGRAADVAGPGRYVLLTAMLLANRNLPGLTAAALGTAANGIAIVVNGGWMPVWQPSLAAAGFDPTTSIRASTRC